METNSNSAPYWVWSTDKVSHGPMDLFTLVDWVRKRRITPETWIYCERRLTWTKAPQLDELKLLCADVEQDLADDGTRVTVDLESIEGSTKPAKVLGLIQYLDRRGCLSYLVRAVRLHRPGIL